MKQTIEIEVPDGKKAVWKDGKVVFEDIKPQLPRTWEEFCEQNMIKNEEYFLGIHSDFVKRGYGQRYKNTDKNILPSKQAAEAHLALMQLHQLRDVWREGWLPDWTDERQSKYVILNLHGIWKTAQHTTTSRFLAFQDKKKADEFLTNFRELIEQARDLI